MPEKLYLDTKVEGWALWFCFGNVNIYPDPNGTLDIPFVDAYGNFIYTHPTPYSLTQTFVMNDDASYNAGEDHSGNPLPGIEHSYNIDKNINLLNINPNEKIIYNPSECEISASNLVFPSEYTFKTLHLPGDYILLDDLKAHYPYVLYDESELKDIPVSTNSQPAHYIIKSGAKLTIEPCVTIMDAIFTVESGGVLEYDKTQTYGNYQIDPLSEGSFAPTISEFSNCECDCKDFTRYNIMGNIDITSNITWDQAYIESSFEVPTGGTVGIAGKVSVPAGVTLTIKNITVQFSNIGEIIVEPGARLIVDGSTLNSACNKLWVGINVKGNSNLPQLLPNQGFVSLKNGSEIRDASYALNIKGGGIVSTVGTTFKNNKIGIYFNPYQLQSYNASSISNNIFITETQRAFNSLFAHVYLNGVKGVTLKGNDFINTQGSTLISTTGILPLYANGRGYGIYSKNSSFKVLPSCSSQMQYGASCPESDTEESNFGGLYYGIKANSINSALPVTIQQSKFDGNFRGVLLENFQYPNVLDNVFFGTYSGNGVNPNILYPPAYYNTVYGLYLNGCSNYRVEDNDFTNGDAGVFVNNSGISANRIYNNIFTDVNKTENASALNALGANYDNINEVGLQFVCNDFHTSQYNMSVIGGATIARFQGSSALSAGNHSDHFCPNSESDFNISQSSPISSYNYYYALNEQNTCVTQPPKLYQIPANASNTCPSQLTTGGGISPSDLISYVSILNNQISNQKEIIYNITDGGNTQAMLNLVYNLKPNNFNKSCSTLLNASPYLSDTVLYVFMNTTVNGHTDKKRDVLLANSPLPENSRKELENINLPNPIKQQILNAQVGVNPLDIQKEELASYISEKQHILNELTGYYLYNDSLSGMLDSAITVYNTESDLFSKNNLIPLLILDYRYNDAQTEIQQAGILLDAMPLPVKQKYLDYFNLQDVLIQYLVASEDTQVFSNNLSLINRLAYDKNAIGNIQAQIILETFFEEDIPEDIEFPDEAIMQRNAAINSMSINNEQYQYLHIFPNPTDNFISIEYSLSNPNERTRIEIFDLLGNKLIEKEFFGISGTQNLDVSVLTNGIYLIKCNEDYYSRFCIVR